MSEDKSHFRIKVDEIEIEYEGKSTEVSTLYREVFEWVKSSAKLSFKPEQVEEKEMKKKKGGPRAGVISTAIDKLIDESFFDEFKNSTQVFDEIIRRNVPVSSIDRVIHALNRKVPEKLDRIKDPEERWVYRKKQ